MNPWIVAYNSESLEFSVDLKKAYDHVNWDILVYLLQRCGKLSLTAVEFCIKVILFPHFCSL